MRPSGLVLAADLPDAVDALWPDGTFEKRCRVHRKTAAFPTVTVPVRGSWATFEVAPSTLVYLAATGKPLTL